MIEYNCQKWTEYILVEYFALCNTHLRVDIYAREREWKQIKRNFSLRQKS